MFKTRRQQPDGFLRGNNLIGLGQGKHPGGNINRIAENLVLFYHYRAVMQTDFDRDVKPDQRRIIPERLMHFASSTHRLLRIRKTAHNFIANCLANNSVIGIHFSGKHIQHARLDPPRLLSTILIKQLGAAAIRKQYSC